MARSYYPSLIGVILFIGGATVMLGWLLKQPALLYFSAGGKAMVSATAVCFMLAGIALMSAVFSSHYSKIIRFVAACGISIIAGLMLLENFFPSFSGVDFIAFHTWLKDTNPHPGRMAPNTALAMLMGSIALLRAKPYFQIMPYALAAVMLSISALGIVGALLLLDLAYNWYGFSRMALMTGFGVALFASALIVERLQFNKNNLDASQDLRLKGEAGIYSFLGVAVTLFVTMMLVSYGSIRSLDARNNWVEHTYEVQLSADKMVASYLKMHLVSERKDFEFLANEIRNQLSFLIGMTIDNPPQQDRVKNIKRLVEQRLEAIDEIMPSDQINLSLNMAGLETASFDRLVEEFITTENQLLDKRKAESEQSTSSTIIVIVVGNMLGFVMLLLAFNLLKRQNEQRSLLEVALQKANIELEHNVHERTQELARANNDLAGMNATLEQRIGERTAELESFSYSISHDLRAPLRAIDGFGLMLEEDYAGKLDKDGARYLSVIRSNSQRMGHLIDDLLTFSRLGRQNISKNHLEMTLLVKEVMQEISQDSAQNAAFKKADIQLLDLPGAKADRSLLKQVWINLLSNAIKYSSKVEQAVIKISASVNVDQHEVVYSVQDNGVGFSMDYYNKLFGVFQRLHHNNEISGTGVGLAIAQRVLLRHGGRIWAESKINEGATFFFTLPIGEPNE
ncbi:signal transduction histidine kinase [Undibacterium sp. GrIS 1.8]|uniref:sensor histidine kinase n=1 Tax=Undibacterium sp. GrIS 1.8 TaxID=3143934 RepID=UPI00339307BF